MENKWKNDHFFLLRKGRLQKNEPGMALKSNQELIDILNFCSSKGCPMLTGKYACYFCVFGAF